MTRAYHDTGSAQAGAVGTVDAPRRELDLFDVIALAWSQKGFIALIFAVIFAVGVAASLILLQPSYTAETRLLVLLDSNPTPTAAGVGDAFMLDQVMQSESELLSSDAVRRLALETLGADVVLGEAAGLNADGIALRELRAGFELSREPNSSAINASFKSRSAERSALILNTIVDAYLAYREQVLFETGFSGLEVRREQADTAVRTARGELESFLLANEIANFEAERGTAENLVGNLTERISQARGERDMALAGASALRERLTQIPESIELYVENGVSGVLLDRRAERASLLSRYQPAAPAVQAVEREIAAIESFIASGAAEGEGQRRTGANPVRQALESELATREANAEAQASLATALEQQARANRALISRLRQLEPEYTRLAQNVTAAEEAAAAVAGLEATASARRSPSLGAADAVRLIDRASPPMEGQSMKKLGLIGAFVAAAGIALFLGLLRGYWLTYVRAVALPRPRPVASASAVATQPAPGHPVAANDPFDGLPVLAHVADRSV
ncbi:Wzz/FepE/Etk N-terminal domain-containing protein [uncultured Maricaulis sp.]|uniref:GumC family protein n=1 Tax=uncultured Maricaulis sp. TaxID=174710 RepID=UPI00262F6643|nr:Wzz/FepE/Etk N-terminal domain-containing protein [uncultured Maricaulis sp.]